MGFKKRKASKATQDFATFGEIGKSILKALPVALLAGILLLLGATALLMTTQDPAKHHASLALTSLYLSALLGGIAATRFCHRRAPAFCGIGIGMLLLLLFSALSILLPGELAAQDGALGVLARSAVPAASLLGSMLGAKEKKRRHRR